MVELKPGEKVSRAIIDLQKDQPFFAVLAMAMRPRKMGPEQPMQTMGVDAKGHLYYADAFVEKQGSDVMKGVLAHETLHVALLHMLRRGNRNPFLSNVAQDVVVNNIVKRAGLELPKGGIEVDIYRDESQFTLPIGGAPVEFRIRKVSEKVWETIYEELRQKIVDDGKDPEGAGYPQGWDDHRPGQGEDGQELSDEEIAREQNRMRQQVAAAATYAKQQGKLPAGMERFLDDILAPKMPWKALLLKHLKAGLTPTDWTYARPHKKSQVLEVYLPSTVKESCEVEVLVDTSGSVGQDELSEFVAEIVGIANSLPSVKMWVSFCDAQIHERIEVENGDIPKILAAKVSGGGGTNLEVGIDEVKKRNPEVPVVVVFTDGEDTYHRSVRDYPFEVIWVISSKGIGKEEADRRIPYGRKVKM